MSLIAGSTGSAGGVAPSRPGEHHRAVRDRAARQRSPPAMTLRPLPSTPSIDDEMDALLRDAGVTPSEIGVLRQHQPQPQQQPVPSPRRPARDSDSESGRSRSHSPNSNSHISASRNPNNTHSPTYKHIASRPNAHPRNSHRDSGVWDHIAPTAESSSMARRKPVPVLDAVLDAPPTTRAELPRSERGNISLADAAAQAAPLRRARPAPVTFSPPPPPADEPDAPYSPITVRPASWRHDAGRPAVSSRKGAQPQQQQVLLQQQWQQWQQWQQQQAKQPLPEEQERPEEQEQRQGETHEHEKQQPQLEAVHETTARMSIPPTPPPEPVVDLSDDPLPRSRGPARKASADSTSTEDSMKSMPDWLATSIRQMQTTPEWLAGAGSGSLRTHRHRASVTKSTVEVVMREQFPLPPAIAASPNPSPVAESTDTFGTVPVPEPAARLRTNGLPHGAHRLSGSDDSDAMSDSSAPAASRSPASPDPEIRTPTLTTFPAVVAPALRNVFDRGETEANTSDEDAEFVSAEDAHGAPVARVALPVPRPHNPSAAAAAAHNAAAKLSLDVPAATGTPTGPLTPTALPARKVSLPARKSIVNLTPSGAKRETLRTATHGLDYEAFDEDYMSDDSTELKRAPGKAKRKDSWTVSRLPAERTLWEASERTVKDEDGNEVRFGDLFPSYGDLARNNSVHPPKTVVIFVRHFWCGACQSYMEYSLSKVDPAVVRAHNLRVVLIGCGSWKSIKAYKGLFNLQYEMYTDRSRRIYQLFGLKTPGRRDNAPKTHGAYNLPIWTQTTTCLKRGVKYMRHSPGSIQQLGGEFVLVPGFKAEFAHRMSNYYNHMEFPDVLKHAGVEVEVLDEAPPAVMPRKESAVSTSASITPSTLETELEKLETGTGASCAIPDEDEDESDGETDTEENEDETNRRFEAAMAREQALAAQHALGTPPRASQVGLAL
ncbi:hypothetical protein Q8F55_001462 [Vanrija albida]|uniref:Thioredoxin domain-containing protein n=1 Tax=Vanrija albida TaxID=181172 RepID=A0ABR3QG28_9TREE